MPSRDGGRRREGHAHRPGLRRAVARARAVARPAAGSVRADGARGVSGRLTSIVPPITVPAWSCMMASRTPGDLGVYGFRNRADHTYDGAFIADGSAIKRATALGSRRPRGRKLDRGRRPGHVSAAAAARRDGQLLPHPLDGEPVHVPAARCKARGRARSSASTSSTARTSAPTTRTTSCGRSTR